MLEEPYVEPNYMPDEPMPRFGVPSYQWHLSALAPGAEAEGRATGSAAPTGPSDSEV